MADTHTPAAPASGSTTPGKADAATAAATAASPDGVTSTNAGADTDIEQLSDVQIMDAFLGREPEPEPEEGEEAPPTQEEEEEGSDPNSEPDPDEAEGQLESGLLKELKDKPGLHKRVKQLFAQNKQLKAQAEQAKPEPEVLAAPEVTKQWFSTARNEAEVEQQAQSITQDARAKLRWLNRHLDGGIYVQGDQAIEMNAEQVDKAIEDYETLLGSVDTAKAARKQWLQQYAESYNTLADQAAELVNPQTPTRESKLIREVPELARRPDYLELLADAKAGRELREKRASGIQVVEVDPSKPKPKPAPSGAAQPRQTPARQERRGGSGDPAASSPLASESLEALRAKADDGDKRAQEEITRRFMAA